MTFPDSAWRRGAEDRIQESIASLLDAGLQANCDLVLLFPPFGSPDRPSLGLSIIAGVARRAGLVVNVLYANLSFASVIGLGTYRQLCHTPTEHLIGERLFALAGPDRLPRSKDVPACLAEMDPGLPCTFEELQSLAEQWVDTLSLELASRTIPMLGATTVFEQTRSALALLHGTKVRNPGTRTLLGGANVEADMGFALSELAESVDHVFSGESEESFLCFLQDLNAGKAPAKVIGGKPLSDMNSLPVPHYDDYFRQLAAILGKDAGNAFEGMELRLPYESSRGCWWGEKHHCTFCGLNAEGMTHRTKAPEKVMVEIGELVDRHDINRVLMVDNIMPHGYFSSLLPKLAMAERRVSLFYEQKSNLSLNRMKQLRAAGVDEIQPGIESLSTALLKRMRKGSTAQTGLNCLRYARANGIRVAWNLLCDFPGDDEDDYLEMAALIPLLHHLQPPGGVSGLSIDRFSPYFNTPDEFGISDVTPLPAYGDVFPPSHGDRIAYHFSASYESAIRRMPTLHGALEAEVSRWSEAWKQDTPPLFCVLELSDEKFLLLDHRGLGNSDADLVSLDEASLILSGCPADTPAAFPARDAGQLAEVDGRWVALSFADPDCRGWA